MKKLWILVVMLLLAVSLVGCFDPDAPLNHTYVVESEHYSVELKVEDGYVEYRKVCNLETEECTFDYDWDNTELLTNADETQVELGLDLYINMLENFYQPVEEDTE